MVAMEYPANIRYPSRSIEPRAKKRMLYAGIKSVSGTGNGSINKNEHSIIIELFKLPIKGPSIIKVKRCFVILSNLDKILLIPFNIFNILF